ncbi:hypothetical protein FIBSPDRAFT_894023 [Athelia psychrophila]|uniref:Uncharacterized protein n=1 Tax=Athelia psychrophila TaxID=1759441 RepID=A0A166GFK1_9AGAM|nr:hypothetical protein FIBSPDRAFT_894023 [Fibularhizoctonia sp. CBS 109695]
MFVGEMHVLCTTEFGAAGNWAQDWELVRVQGTAAGPGTGVKGAADAGRWARGYACGSMGWAQAGSCSGWAGGRGVGGRVLGGRVCGRRVGAGVWRVRERVRAQEVGVDAGKELPRTCGCRRGCVGMRMAGELARAQGAGAGAGSGRAHVCAACERGGVGWTWARSCRARVGVRRCALVHKCGCMGVDLGGELVCARGHRWEAGVGGGVGVWAWTGAATWVWACSAWVWEWGWCRDTGSGRAGTGVGVWVGHGDAGVRVWGCRRVGVWVWAWAWADRCMGRLLMGMGAAAPIPICAKHL